MNSFSVNVFWARTSSLYCICLKNFFKSCLCLWISNIINLIYQISYFPMIKFCNVGERFRVILIPVFDLCFTFKQTKSIFLIKSPRRWILCLEFSRIIDLNMLWLHIHILWFVRFWNRIGIKQLSRCIGMDSQRIICWRTNGDIRLDVSVNSRFNKRKSYFKIGIVHVGILLNIISNFN